MILTAPMIATLALFGALASCAPWTVRPINEEKAQPATAAARVDAIWAARLVPAVKNGAVDARTLLDAIAASPGAARTRYGHCGSGDCYYMVKGTGKVLSVDTRSRVGLAMVDVAPYDGRADVSIQIGPVLRGTSLRDATGVIRFTDFVNQLEFADAGNEVNARVLKTVLAGIGAASLKGREIAFAGTVAAQDESSPPLGELVPVELKEAGHAAGAVGAAGIGPDSVLASARAVVAPTVLPSSHSATFRCPCAPTPASAPSRFPGAFDPAEETR